MKRLLIALALALAVLPAAAASAHPLGNFSVNRLAVVQIASDRIDVAYTIDQAEIPTFRERGRPRAEILASKVDTVARGLRVTADGEPLPLRAARRPSLSFPRGQGGLSTTRVELHLSARVLKPREVVVRDRTYGDRVGWKAIVARPAEGTSVRASVPVSDPTRGLREYPRDLLASPLDERTARFDVRPGDGSVVGARGASASVTTTERGGNGGFAALLDRDIDGAGVLAFLLIAAFAWGALHALSPGHGKTMVAAYLVGTRGGARAALALGATVTVAHTAGVFALGFVTLALSAYVLPEQLYPWLNLTSGLLVVGVGIAVLRSRWRGAHGAHHHDHHQHDHAHGHGHTHDHGHAANGPRGRRGLLALGASAGMIPCPTALVVLLGAIAQHQVALGLLLIVLFSAGLATTLSLLGLAVVHGGRLLARVRAPGALTTALPALSAAVIVVAGALLTVQALPQLVA